MGGSDLTVSSRHGDGGIRTHGFTVLNRLPIPFGYNGKQIKTAYLLQISGLENNRAQITDHCFLFLVIL